MSGQRFLRPGAAFGIGDRVWVVDEFQPVAALVDPVEGTVEDLVDWRDLGPPPAGESVAMISDGHRLWVQQGVHSRGLIANVDTGGLRRVTDSWGTRLCTADESGAWAVDNTDVSVALGDGEPPPLQDGRVLLVRPGGRTRVIEVDRPVRWISTESDGAYLRVSSDPPVLHSRGCGWSCEYPSATLFVSNQQPLPDRIELACFAVPESSEPDRDDTGPWRYSYELLNMTEHGVDTGRLPWSARTPRCPGRSTSTTRGTDPVLERARDVVESRPSTSPLAAGRWSSSPRTRFASTPRSRVTVSVT